MTVASRGAAIPGGPTVSILPWLIRISAAGAVDVSVSRTLPLVMRVNDIADFGFGARQN
jgi:hypothetical protein